MKKQTNLLEQTITVAGIMILSFLVFLCHRHTPFMMDDNWYATNLATGENLNGFSDIIESQVWHFLNWGGRNITHGILQVTLMLGETAADVINLVMTLLLAWMICVIAGQKKPFWFLSAFTMLIGLNANVKMSMFWQAGAANYVYATVWILFFVWIYIRKIENPDKTELFLVNLWMIPLGLITGWSNENMGPASCLLAVAVMIIIFRHRSVEAFFHMAALYLAFISVISPASTVHLVDTCQNLSIQQTFADNTFSRVFVESLSDIADIFLLMIPLLLLFLAINRRTEPAPTKG